MAIAVAAVAIPAAMQAAIVVEVAVAAIDAAALDPANDAAGDGFAAKRIGPAGGPMQP